MLESSRKPLFFDPTILNIPGADAERRVVHRLREQQLCARLDVRILCFPKVRQVLDGVMGCFARGNAQLSQDW